MDVHQYQIRLILADQLDSFLTIGGLANDHDSGLKGKQRS
jgi:hypothetical protein